MMTMTLRNRDRVHHLSGYGRINYGLQRFLSPVQDDLDAEVHIFASPPCSFYPMAGKFNVGLTYCDRPIEKYTGFDFTERCNKMDLLFTSGEKDRQAFIEGGVTTKIIVSPPGFDHMAWVQPIQRDKNHRVLILTRGRDVARQVDVAKEFFSKVQVLGSDSLGDLPDTELKDVYRGADVFLKWADEYTWSYPVLEAMAAGCLVVANSPYVFLNKQNSFHFCDEDQLRKILNSCKTKTYIDKKKRAQADVYGLNWETSAARMLETIHTEYRRIAPLNP